MSVKMYVLSFFRYTNMQTVKNCHQNVPCKKVKMWYLDHYSICAIGSSILNISLEIWF